MTEYSPCKEVTSVEKDGTQPTIDMSYMKIAKAKRVRPQLRERPLGGREGRKSASGKKNLVTPFMIACSENLEKRDRGTVEPEVLVRTLSLFSGTDSGRTRRMKSKFTRKHPKLMMKIVDTVLDGRKCRTPPAI